MRCFCSLEDYGVTNYQVHSKGAFGTIFLVRDKADNVFVIKQLKLNNNQNNYNQKTECDVLRKFDDQFIVRCLDIFAILDGEFYLCIGMEYCDGGDLAKLIRSKSTPFAEYEISEIFVQVALGVKALHEKNIVHRDLKPSNIFCTTDNVFKVGDFGCALDLGLNVTCTTSFCGTVSYMAPELLCTKRDKTHESYCSLMSDIWSLGCILYELITLRRMFAQTSYDELLNSIFQAKYEPLAKEICSMDLRLLVNKMLNPDDEERPTIVEVLSLPYFCDTLQMIKKRIAPPYAMTKDSEFRRYEPEFITDSPCYDRINLLPLKSFNACEYPVVDWSICRPKIWDYQEEWYRMVNGDGGTLPFPPILLEGLLLELKMTRRPLERRCQNDLFVECCLRKEESSFSYVHCCYIHIEVKCTTGTEYVISHSGIVETVEGLTLWYRFQSLPWKTFDANHPPSARLVITPM